MEVLNKFPHFKTKIDGAWFFCKEFILNVTIALSLNTLFDLVQCY